MVLGSWFSVLAVSWTNAVPHGSMQLDLTLGIGAMADQQAIELAAGIVRGAQRIVALTGAGISRPSGIPDFRSEAGLWKLDDPMVVASLGGFRANPDRFYNWFRPLLKTISAAQPN